MGGGGKLKKRLQERGVGKSCSCLRLLFLKTVITSYKCFSAPIISLTFKSNAVFDPAIKSNAIACESGNSQINREALHSCNDKQVGGGDVGGLIMWPRHFNISSYSLSPNC